MPLCFRAGRPSARRLELQACRLLRAASSFAPPAPPPSDADVARIAEFVAASSRLLVLTGAGCSTESGVPDYRSPSGAYSTGFKPTTHQAFVKHASSRSRYWSRSFLGWPAFAALRPNAAHAALASLSAAGRVHALVTQNVDRLDTLAGSRGVLELHGTTHEVVCLDCGAKSCRHRLQSRMEDSNPGWVASAQPVGAPLRPDGDVEAPQNATPFEVPPCDACGGILKPYVVFFGDNLPPSRAERSLRLAAEADALLVVGTSLATLSSFRLAKAVASAGRPVAVVCCGDTRADGIASLKVRARAGEVLPRVVAHGSLDIPTLTPAAWA